MAAEPKEGGWRLVAGHSNRRPPRGLSQELGGRVSAEREVAAHTAVAEALSGWEGSGGGFERLLTTLAQSLDCEVGVLWAPRGDRLRPEALSYTRGEDLGRFKMMTLTSRLAPGMELPGQAWQSREPRSASGAGGSGPPRLRAATAAGLRGAIAFPAIWAGEVLAVIELISRGELEMGERLKRSLAAIGSVVGQFLAHHRGLIEERLITDRQVEILGLAARGLSGPEIAERLTISPKTVKSHFEHSYTRLGVHSRAGAVAEAIRLGLVD
jgi:DNA-binding CsgD family transcriptional regulator